MEKGGLLKKNSEANREGAAASPTVPSPLHFTTHRFQYFPSVVIPVSDS